MQPTLTLQEEQLARNLKSQGKSTQEILGAIAQSRTAKITPPRPTQEPQASTFGRVIRDIPSDFVEMGQGVRGAVQRGSENLRQSFTEEGLTRPQQVASGLATLGKSVTDVVGEAAIGYGKMFTTDEFEKSVAQKIGQTGQEIAQTDTAKKISDWYKNQDEDVKFALSRIIAPMGEVIAEGATVGAGRAATTPIRAGIQGATDAIGEVAQSVPTIGRQVDTPITAPLPPEVRSAIVQGFDTAIKPNLASKQTPVQRARYESQVGQAVESISNNVENLKLVDEATGETISKLPENLKEFVDALEQTKQTIFQQYDDIATKAGEMQAQIDTVRIANSLDEIINSNSLKLSNPESIRYAQDVRDRLLSTRNLTAIDAQDAIRNYNNSLDAFYRNPTPEGLSRNAVDALVANQMRRALDEEIDSLTGAQYQALKNEYAALKAIERDVMRAYNRDARKNAKGLIDFTDVFSGGQVISGILSFNPAMIAQGVGQKAIASAIKMVNDPNRKVRQIFQEAGRYKRPDAGMATPSRRQLPAPQAGAARSEVGSGAPIAVGGQTARGRVEPGVTERAREGAVQRSDSEVIPTFTEQALKQLTDAGVNPETVQKAIVGGTVGVLLMAYLDEDGMMLPAGLAMLSAMPNSVRRNALNDAIKAIDEKRAALSASGLSDTSAAIKKNQQARESLIKKRDELDRSFNQGATPQTTALLEEAKKLNVDDTKKYFQLLPQSYLKKPKVVYRGVDDSGQGMSKGQGGAAFEGYGLYTNTNKKVAQDYAGKTGTILELDPSDSIPQNPLYFREAASVQDWITLVSKEIGIKPKEFETKVGLNNLIKELGYDGVAFDMNGGVTYVKYPD